MTAKRNITIALSSVIVILTGLSCSRTEVESTGIAGWDIPISFSAGVEETKSLFTRENFSRAGHKIAVFDVFDGEQLYMGSIDGQGKGTPVIYTSSPETSPYWSTDGNYAHIISSHIRPIMPKTRTMVQISLLLCRKIKCLF